MPTPLPNDVPANDVLHPLSSVLAQGSPNLWTAVLGKTRPCGEQHLLSHHTVPFHAH